MWAVRLGTEPIQNNRKRYAPPVMYGMRPPARDLDSTQNRERKRAGMRLRPSAAPPDPFIDASTKPF